MPEQPTISRAFFREADDGSSVFFPWGLAHRGFQIRGEDDRKRASRAVSLFLGATIFTAMWTAHALQPILRGEARSLAEALAFLAWPGAAFVAAAFGYWLWVSRFTEHLVPSELQVPRA